MKSLPDISNWNVEKVNNFCLIFCKCDNLKSFPDLSKWKIFQNVNKNEIFEFYDKIGQIILPKNDFDNWEYIKIKKVILR